MSAIYNLMELSELQEWSADSISDGVITNVKILGSVSRNKRIYPDATRQMAVGLLENCKVNIDHARKDVPLTSRIGKLINVRNTAEGVFGDLHYLTSHPYASALKESAEKMPEILGLSIVGNGLVGKKDKDGNSIIESIDRIISCDLVANPATTCSLYEQADPAEAENVDHVWEGVKAAVVAAMDEGGSTQEKLAKIKELLKGYEKSFGKKDEDKPEEAAGEKPAEQPAQEALQKQIANLTEQVQRLEQKALVKTPKSGLNTAAQPKDKSYYTALLRGN